MKFSGLQSFQLLFIQLLSACLLMLLSAALASHH
jgi:hypothetical protein